MGTTSLIKLYPPPNVSHSLDGVYLDHDIRSLAPPGQTYVYTNFIVSLDGRISETDPDTGVRQVPSAMTNDHDLKLFAELAAQSDILLTSARHLRAAAAGRYLNLLMLDDALIEWRKDKGLVPQPRIAVVGQSLDFPLERLADDLKARLLIITTQDAPSHRLEALVREGIEVTIAAEGPSMTGRAIVDVLVTYQFNHVYSIAGPKLFRTLLEAKQLHRLYLTLAPMLIGGDGDSLMVGPRCNPPHGFRLVELYFDPQTPPSTGQLFATFEPDISDHI